MNKPTRKSNRLKNFDYSTNGAYFITVCTKDMKCILSKISVVADTIRPKIELTPYGTIVNDAIKNIPSIYEGVFIDGYVIMPNHIHMIIRIDNNGGRMISAPTIVGSMKRWSSRKIGVSIWQKGFYDHIIRDDYDYSIRMQYIDENPRKWLIGKDEYYS